MGFRLITKKDISKIFGCRFRLPKSLQPLQILILLVAITLCLPTASYAGHYEDQIVVTELGTVENTTALTIVKSTGLWMGKVATSSVNFNVSESSVQEAIASGGMWTAPQLVWFDIKLPQEATDILNSGGEIKWELVKTTRELSDMFPDLDFTYSYRSSNTVLRILTRVYLKISTLRTLNDYVSGISCTVPLVDCNYGITAYNVYSGSKVKGESEGWYEDSKEMDYVKSPWISPSLIMDSSGTLKSGYSITIKSTLYNGGSVIATDGLTVGKGTNLQKATPCVFKFYFPFAVKFTKETTQQVYVEDTPTASEYRLHRLK